MAYNQRWLIKNRSEKLSEIYSSVDSIYTDETIIADDETINRDYKNYEENLPQREREEITIEYKEKINPYHNSNIFSKIFFYWAYKIIQLSNRIRIQNEHFGRLSEENQSINFSAKLKSFWKDKKYKDKENGVFKAMMTFNASELISCTLLWGMVVLLELLEVILFREFIETFNSNTAADVKKSVIVACVYFILKFFSEIITRYVWFYMVNLSLKTKYQLQGLAYDKLLKMAPASRNPKISNGKIINIVTEDTDKFKVLVLSVNDLLFGPIKIVVYSALLVKYFGLSAGFGIAVLLFSILANYFIFKWNMKALSERKLKKDSRIEYSNETLSNIKILKLYAWERKYYKKIKKERDEELELVKKSFMINSLNIANLNWMPVLISSVILGVYQYTDKKMNVQNVMTGMYIFNILRNAFRNLPVVLEQVANAIVSFKRIQEFLNLDEINKSNVLKDEIDFSLCYIEKMHNDNINENSIDSLNLNILENSTYVNIRYNEDDFLNKNNINNNNNNFNNNQNVNYNNHTFFNEDDNNVAIKIPNLSFSWGKADTKAGSETLSMNLDETKIEKNTESKIYMMDEDVFDKILEEEHENLAAEADYPIEENIPTTLKNISLKIKRGELIGIFGKIGSGKSSLLQAILNNMIIINHNLPQDDKHFSNEKILIRGSIAYTSQTPWIENATLRENILFYSEFNEQKYNEVIRLCELESDLKQLPGADFTEIGEKGVNLSGGQKSRISLARAVYADRDIIVLDDPLSALDAQVGAKIMKNLICSYLHGKTRVLVTHAIHFLENCDQIIHLNEGKVAWAGNAKALKNSLLYKKLINNLNMKKLKEEEISRENTLINDIEDLMPSEQESTGKEQEVFSANKNNNENQNESVFMNTAISEVTASEATEEDSSCLGSFKNTSNELRNKIHKIISQEDREIGKVRLSVYLNYVKHLGGYLLTLLIFLLQIGWQILKVFSDKWLISWMKNNSQETMWKNLAIYFALGTSSIVLMYISVMIIYYRSVNCSKSLHQLIISKLISAPISTFHETVPLGRIMNRLANDLGSVDTELSNRLIQFITFFSTLIGVFIICGFYFPVSFTLLPVLLLVGYLISRFSDHCNRELNRLLQISVSPISHLTMETVSGSEVVRAFGQEEEFVKKFHLKLDTHYKIHLYASAVAAWFHLIMGIISSLLLAMFLVFSIYFREKFNQGTVALMLTYCILFYQNVFQTLFAMRNFEIDLIKMERCLSFTKIPSESKMVLKHDKELFDSNEESHEESLNYNSNNTFLNLERKQPAWPKEGFIEFRDYSVRYRPDTNIVLKNLNFKIKSGEKVGIIGRTGCGKSTLCLAMFRILEPETGSIFIDGVDICEIGLRTLRSSLTIIPQDPRLMKGTLRYNIDPFGAYSDEKIKEIMDALKIRYLMENPSGLNLLISEAGANLSVGEKQLICIARALLKDSKIVIMDEATANIDFQTEQTIQNALNVLLKGATVLTIAHRIKTIVNYDKILVLSKGKVKEFDSPHNLLKDDKTFFSKLVKKSKISFGNSHKVVNHLIYDIC